MFCTGFLLIVCQAKCPDGHYRAARRLRASQKTEAPFMETVGLKAGFLLARMKAVPAAIRPLIKDRD
jgi:hypothetical protein